MAAACQPRLRPQRRQRGLLLVKSSNSEGEEGIACHFRPASSTARSLITADGPPPLPPAHLQLIGSDPAPLRAVEGDIVTVHWKCINDAGEVLESTRASDEPTSFEVGAGDIVGNRLFEAFDEAVRGLAKGDSIGIKVRLGRIVVQCISVFSLFLG